MATFCLNTKKPNNYAFFCPKSRLHLTVSNPVGSASEVTPTIERALKSKCILDITKNAEPHKAEESVKRAAPEQNPKPEQKQVEESAEKKTRGRKKKAESESEKEDTEKTAE